MNAKPGRSRRTGFTLIELVVSLVSATVLVGGLTTALFVTMKASDGSLTPAAASIEASSCLTQMQAELQCALSVSEQLATAVTVTVQNRQSPTGAADTIRYQWSGTLGAPLTRQYNAGSPQTVAANVHGFSIQYYKTGNLIEFVTVRLQLTGRSSAALETGFALVNRP